MKIRTIALLLCFAFISSFSFIASASSISPDKKYANEIIAQDQYDALINEFQDSKSSELIYPQHYGGAYLNDDGYLVICVTDDTKQIEEQYLNHIKSTSSKINIQNIIFEKVNYSYNTLVEIQDKIGEFLEAHLSTKDELLFTGTAIYDDRNCVVVSLCNYSEEAIQKFKEQIMDSPAIEFEQGPRTPIPSTGNLKAGQKIGSYSASYGFRAF